MNKILRSVISSTKYQIPDTQPGLTLIELIIYLGVLGIVMALVLSIAVPLFKTTSTVAPEARVRENLNFIFNTILQKSLLANSVEIIPDFAVRFRYNNTTSVDVFRSSLSVSFNSSTTELSGYPFNYNIGYLSLNCSDRNICGTVGYKVKKSPTTTSEYTGWAWSPEIGWVSFNCDNMSIDSCTTYLVKETATTTGYALSGYAWNDIIGWISFNCNQPDASPPSNICSTSNYSVIRSTSTNYLSGYAWNDAVGWIYFDGEGGKVYLREGNSNEAQLSSESVKASNFAFVPAGSIAANPSFRVTLTLIAPPPTPGQEAITVSSQTSFSVK